MALNVKQIVAMGLVLGILSALGYRFLMNPSSQMAAKNERVQLQSINSFELEPVELDTAGADLDVVAASTTEYPIEQDELVETRIPKADTLTEFQMDRVVGRGDSLVYVGIRGPKLLRRPARR